MKWVMEQMMRWGGNILKTIYMLNREIIRRKLEKLESNLTKQQFVLRKQGTMDEYVQIHNDMKELVSEIKGYIEHEPRTGNEINTSI
jgi:hypothetical protein